MYENNFKLFGYNEAIANTVNLNDTQLQDYMMLEIPRDPAKYLTLKDMSEIASSKGVITIDFTNKIDRSHKLPWLKVDKSIINSNPGFHMYQLVFKHSITLENIVLYFCYRVQTDTPDKSNYIYMKGRD